MKDELFPNLLLLLLASFVIAVVVTVCQQSAQDRARLQRDQPPRPQPELAVAWDPADPAAVTKAELLPAASPAVSPSGVVSHHHSGSHSANRSNEVAHPKP